MCGDNAMDQPGNVIFSILSDACRAGRSDAPLPSVEVDRKGRDRLVNRVEKYWITQLRSAFATYYSSPSYVVFPVDERDRRFRLNRFLFDATVLKLRHRGPLSLDRHIEMPVIERVIWQVESEMAGNWRAVAVDLGKLVCGSAENKLLVVRRPDPDRMDETNSLILDLAQACTGNLFIAYIPVYATGHRDLDEHWMKPNLSLPFQLYARDQTLPTGTRPVRL